MTILSPSLALMLVLAILYGTVFHLWRGRTWRDLALYLLLALSGMLIAQPLGAALGLNILRIGPTYFFEGTLLSGFLMLAAAWLKG